MRVIILGSAAGGGLPQWNCGCANCRAARDGGAARTQSSVAVSADGERWIILNASRDLRVQLAAHRSLWPRGARGTPINAVILTDGEIDHTLGLMLLREGTSKLAVYAPTGVAALLGAEWPLYRVLAAYAGVAPRALPEARPLQLADAGGESLGVQWTALPVARRPPRYAHAAPAATFDVGLRLRDERTGGTLPYIPPAGGGGEPGRGTPHRGGWGAFGGCFWAVGAVRGAAGARPPARSAG